MCVDFQKNLMPIICFLNAESDDAQSRHPRVPHDKTPMEMPPKAEAVVFAPDVGDIGLTKFAVRASQWNSRAKVYRGVLKPLEKYPMRPSVLGKVIYDNNVDLNSIYRQARAIAKSMFGKENNVRSVLETLFYVPNKNIFVVVLRARSELEPKVIQNNDYFGVEFKYDLYAKYSVQMNTSAIVLLTNSSLRGNALIAELSSKIVAEHPSAVQLVN